MASAASPAGRPWTESRFSRPMGVFGGNPWTGSRFSRPIFCLSRPEVWRRNPVYLGFLLCHSCDPDEVGQESSDSVQGACREGPMGRESRGLVHGRPRDRALSTLPGPLGASGVLLAPYTGFHHSPKKASACWEIPRQAGAFGASSHPNAFLSLLIPVKAGRLALRDGQ